MLGSRWFRVAIVGLLASIAALALSTTDQLQRVEGSFIDARFDQRGLQEPPEDVVLVGINERSFDELGARWPFPRSMHARVIRRLLAAGARSIAYDVQFTEPSRPAEDRALLDAAADPRVVLGTAKLNAQYEPVVLGGAEALERRGGHVGVVYFPTDVDGVWRSMEGLVEGVPHMSVLAARGTVDDEARPIDFAGPPTTLPDLEFSDILIGRFDPKQVEGKIVVVGATTPSLLDLHATAAGPEMPGPEAMANAIQTVVDGYPLSDAPRGIALLLILLAATVPSLATLHGPPWRAVVQALAAGIGSTAVLLVGAQVAFNNGTIVPVATPLLALAFGTAGAVALTYAIEVRARRRLRGEFERFAPPPVVDKLLAHRAGSPELTGQKTTATIMFSDLRGFTTLAERLPAEDVTRVLDRYFETVSGAVFRTGGTVVSYQGDGVMAVFGAPVESDDHASRGLTTVRDLVETGLPEFNRWLVAEQLSDAPLRVGVGLNSGQVIAGLVGPPTRVEFAVIGDATNVAARLQTLGRDHPQHSAFVSESTYEALPEADRNRLERLAEVDLRGRTAPVAVYTLS